MLFVWGQNDPKSLLQSFDFVVYVNAKKKKKITCCLLCIQERLESTWDTIAVYNHDKFWSSGAQILVSYSFELVAARSVSKLFFVSLIKYIICCAILWWNILFVAQRMHCVIYAHIYIHILALCIHHVLLHSAAIVSTQIKCLKEMSHRWM